MAQCVWPNFYGRTVPPRKKRNICSRPKTLLIDGKVVVGEVQIVMYVEDIPFMKIERRAGSKDCIKPTDTKATTQLFEVQEISYLGKTSD